MPKPKIARPPKFAEPHTVDIPDLESYTAMTEKPPYVHLRRILPQYVVAILLKRLHDEGKRYVRIYMPEECFAGAYVQNPALFAKIVRSQRDNPFQFVIMRHEKDLNRFRITGSENAPQKGNSFLSTCGASMLAEYQKLVDRNKSNDTFSLIFPYANMPRAYQNDQYVFRFRLEKWLREKLEQPDFQLVCHVVDDGYRVTRVPAPVQK